MFEVNLFPNSYLEKLSYTQCIHASVEPHCRVSAGTLWLIDDLIRSSVPSSVHDKHSKVPNIYEDASLKAKDTFWLFEFVYTLPHRMRVKNHHLTADWLPHCNPPTPAPKLPSPPTPIPSQPITLTLHGSNTWPTRIPDRGRKQDGRSSTLDSWTRCNYHSKINVWQKKLSEIHKVNTIYRSNKKEHWMLTSENLTHKRYYRQ